MYWSTIMCTWAYASQVKPAKTTRQATYTPVQTVGNVQFPLTPIDSSGSYIANPELWVYTSPHSQASLHQAEKRWEAWERAYCN